MLPSIRAAPSTQPRAGQAPVYPRAHHRQAREAIRREFAGTLRTRASGQRLTPQEVADELRRIGNLPLDKKRLLRSELRHADPDRLRVRRYRNPKSADWIRLLAADSVPAKKKALRKAVGKAEGEPVTAAGHNGERCRGEPLVDRRAGLEAVLDAYDAPAIAGGFDKFGLRVDAGPAIGFSQAGVKPTAGVYVSAVDQDAGRRETDAFVAGSAGLAFLAMRAFAGVRRRGVEWAIKGPVTVARGDPHTSDRVSVAGPFFALAATRNSGVQVSVEPFIALPFIGLVTLDLPLVGWIPLIRPAFAVYVEHPVMAPAADAVGGLFDMMENGYGAAQRTLNRPNAPPKPEKVPWAPPEAPRRKRKRRRSMQARSRSSEP